MKESSGLPLGFWTIYSIAPRVVLCTGYTVEGGPNKKVRSRIYAPSTLISIESPPPNCQFASRLGLGSGTAFPRQYMIVLQVNRFVTSPIKSRRRYRY
ncbi:hypothetical protein M747DRAFT_296116 [Aspergillus niger ATCC 13496]|uniref:Uncharacterized protein n=1 Tax=Aspergillus niger ATCC 13496 TaxID=1353008 RepID=A0A370C3C0_ASPNG|nr:hypothetical protein M747DRAFT_296116 [Aspergillus niger ATCC 13496]